MNFKLSVIIVGLSILIFSVLQSEPSFNGSTPGCGVSGCHNFKDNDVTAVPIGNLEVKVELSGVASGEKVGGELVDLNGTVIDVVNSTNNNPFILKAPNEGKYIVNAGYKKPSRNWDSSTVDITIISARTNIPDNKISSYQLFQNYPNPFNPTTTIPFSLPEKADVFLDIFNSTGQLIETLVNDRMGIGHYSINWNATHMPSGLYFYRIKAGEFVEMRKMILLR
jgi:hypothetical protein